MLTNDKNYFPIVTHVIVKLILKIDNHFLKLYF